MIDIHWMMLCDEIFEGQLRKFNLMGCHFTNYITIDASPYPLKFVLVVKGKIHQGTSTSNLSIKYVLSDLEGISLIEEIISCGQVTQISNDVQALVLPLPFLINVKFNTVLTFSVLVNDSIASQEVFKIIESEKKNDKQAT